MPSGSRSGLIVKKLSRHLIFTASLFAIASDTAVLPASPFADNLVLQRGMRVPVALWTKGLVSAVGFYYAVPELTKFSRDPAALRKVRNALGNMIEKRK